MYSNYFVITNKRKKLKHKHNLPNGRISQKLLDNYCIGIVTVMIKKEIFDNYKFDENFDIIGDFDFLRLSLKYEIGSIQQPLAFYRIHEKIYQKILPFILKRCLIGLKVTK